MSISVLRLTEALAQERAALAAALEAVAERELAGEPAGPLTAALRYAILGGGKHLRGTLCVLAYRAAGGREHPGLYDVAAALELVHTYSLVHDDLPCMDDDDLRRGRPTLHRVFGSRTAAVAGLALLPLAFRVLGRGAEQLELDGEQSARLARTLARAIGPGGMVGGQWHDLEAEGRGAIGLAELAAIHAAKTGALFEAALALGGLAAAADERIVTALAGFGGSIGLAFQVVDDLLDETGDTASLGKTAGKDRRQEKATYPALLGQAGARARARSAVDEGTARLRAAGVASAELEAVGEWVLARHH